jgi:hypothetical protein
MGAIFEIAEKSNTRELRNKTREPVSLEAGGAQPPASLDCLPTDKLSCVSIFLGVFAAVTVA